MVYFYFSVATSWSVWPCTSCTRHHEAHLVETFQLHLLKGLRYPWFMHQCHLSAYGAYLLTFVVGLAWDVFHTLFRPYTFQQMRLEQQFGGVVQRSPAHGESPFCQPVLQIVHGKGMAVAENSFEHLIPLWSLAQIVRLQITGQGLLSPLPCLLVVAVVQMT